MRRLLFKLGLLLLLLMIVDVFCAPIFNYLQKNAIGGSTQKNYYINKECESDIIILGSSRASHHYVPSVIADLTGYSCYNCGEEGNGIILAFARYQMLVQRYNPKVIIYEITPEYDLKQDLDNSKYLRYLKPYYGEEPIKKVVQLFTEKKTQFELESNLYRNNSAIIANIIDNIIDRGAYNGYEPLFGQCSQMPANLKINNSVPFVVDEMKVALMDSLAIDAHNRGVLLIFAMSPTLANTNTNTYNKALFISNKYHIPFLNYLSCKDIISDISLFQDEGHMNDKGAMKYSEIISHEIKSMMKQVNDEYRVY